MTLVDGRIATQKIIIPLVVNIPHVYAFSAVQNNRKRMIIMGTVMFFEAKKILRALRSCRLRSHNNKLKMKNGKDHKLKTVNSKLLEHFRRCPN